MNSKVAVFIGLFFLMIGCSVSVCAKPPIQSINQKLEKSAKHYPFGIDISKWQTDLMQRLDDPGFSFIICKATEGADMVDPRFEENWAAVKRRKLVRGCYHFYLANADPIEQAAHYLDTIGSWRLFWQDGIASAELPPIIDIENRSVSKNIDIATLQANLLTCLKYLETQTHRKPMIYTSVWFANTYLNNPKFAEYPLWIAHYSFEEKPVLPHVWKNHGAKFWQKSHRYVLASRYTDFNIFFGDIEELKNGLMPIRNTAKIETLKEIRNLE